MAEPKLPVGYMGKFNLPTVSIQRIEQDDEKRAFSLSRTICTSSMWGCPL